MAREPLSEEHLAEIRDRAIRDDGQIVVLDSAMARILAQAFDDRADLLAEVERLRARGRRCSICGGTGIAIQPTAYEDVSGTVQHTVRRIACYGCDFGKQHTLSELEALQH